MSVTNITRTALQLLVRPTFNERYVVVNCKPTFWKFGVATLSYTTWNNRGSESPPDCALVPLEKGGWPPIRWKNGLTTRRRAQASNGERPCRAGVIDPERALR